MPAGVDELCAVPCLSLFFWDCSCCCCEAKNEKRRRIQSLTTFLVGLAAEFFVVLRHQEMIGESWWKSPFLCRCCRHEIYDTEWTVVIALDVAGLGGLKLLQLREREAWKTFFFVQDVVMLPPFGHSHTWRFKCPRSVGLLDRFFDHTPHTRADERRVPGIRRYGTRVGYRNFTVGDSVK